MNIIKFNGFRMKIMGMNSISKEIKIKDENIKRKIKITIWDFPGNNNYFPITGKFVNKFMGIIFVYSINNRKVLNILNKIFLI